MDFFKKQLDTIQQNLAGLNATQKMLTGALVAIMVMTMVYWSRYAGTAEMEPVLNQTLNDEDITRMSASLDARGIPNKVEGGKVLVAADRKMQALASLGYEQLLPRNTASGFEQMLSKSQMFQPQSQADDLKNHAKEITLAQIIGGFPGVSGAVVMIDPTTTRRIGAASTSPTANISITMRSGSPASNKLVNAAADLVCGAVADINRAKIKVVVDGQPRRLQGNDADGIGGGQDQLEIIRENERSLAAKIENQLSFINGVVASVSGTLNTESVEAQEETHDKMKSIIEVGESESKNIESNVSQSGGGEGGALPNVGISVSGNGGSNTTTTDNSEKTKMTILPATLKKNTRKPGGDFTVQSASVRIPESYFIGVLRAKSGGKDPSPGELADFAKAQLDDIRNEVRNCTGIKQDKDNIFVSTYAEAQPAVSATAAAGVVAGGNGISGMIGGWGKEVGVGALAVISLFMVSTMVKRSTPAPIVVAPAEARGPITLDAAEAVAGFASEGNTTLAGMELDDDTIQAQQVIDQVTNLVGENPEGAANLVKRWLNRT